MTTSVPTAHPDALAELALRLAATGALPAYVYDLPALDRHAAAVRAALPGVELFYAVKANPDPELLRTLAPHVDGFEVSSGGEVVHVRSLFPDARLAFGGPGKTDAELALGAWRLHVESPHELRRLARIAGAEGADILLRANLKASIEGAALAMGGGATPFGMDEDGVAECLRLLDGAPHLRLRGVHAHLASGLDAARMLELADRVLGYARDLGLAEINLGGGMAVDYRNPAARFDWAAYGRGLAVLRRPGEVLRIEPGRALTVYCGHYLAQVIDVKRVHGETFAIVTGGTHHLRTPVTKGHDQPFTVIPGPGSDGPRVRDEHVTVVGQLCTPKDVFARRCRSPSSPWATWSRSPWRARTRGTSHTTTSSCTPNRASTTCDEDG